MNEKLGDNIPQPRRRPWQNPRAMQIQQLDGQSQIDLQNYFQKQET